jgi:rod shape-determining protein MreC
MLWRFRKEIIFLIFIFFSFLIEKHTLNKKVDSKTKIKNQYFYNYEEIIEENKRLREIFNLKEKKIITNFKVAEVIGVYPYIFPGEIIINKGKEDGIKKNMIVFTKDLFLIGKVEEVMDRYSKVVSIFNNKTRISVILGSTGEIGIIEGGYAPFILMKYIPYDSKVKIGDDVFTSGFSEYYFPGIKIGKVYKILRDKDSLFLKIWVKPYIASSGLKEVIICE